jgi:hypothetical protein
MPKQEKLVEKPVTKEIIVKTRSNAKNKELDQSFKWWLAQTDDELVTQLLSTTNYLKKTSQIRIRQASMFTRLFSGKPLYNYLANVGTLDNSQQLPIGRPTANVVYSCTDTLVSSITQERPRVVVLTDAGHYKERHLAQTLNNFIAGEFYRTKAHAIGALALRDSCVIGDGFIKVFPQNNKVCLERTLATELLTDYNDAYYGSPRSLIHMKLVDRQTFLTLFPDQADIILKAQHGNVDNTPLSTETISDQFIISEGWRLPTTSESKDGRHAIVCSAGIICDEGYEKSTFPFAHIGYNPNIVGYFSQSLAEILMPTQMEIYKMLIIASQAIELMGVPRILIDEFSAILETAFNNNIGTIIKYSKIPPQFINAQSNPPEIYEWIKWLIENAFQMSGISSMSAAGKLPPGLESGEAQREYIKNQETRFAALEKRYNDLYPDLAYLIVDQAKDIAEETGKYLTVYPDKDGTREVDLPKSGMIKDTYIFKCFEESFLPKDPAGRRATLSEMLAAGEITQQEFRRLNAFPDLEQSNQLAFALEERILKGLDAIIEDGAKGFKDNVPDQFILDPSDLATTLCVQYINKYAVTDIEESKMKLLRDYFTLVQNLKQQAQPQMPQVPMPAGSAQAQSQLPVQPPQASQSPTSNIAV